MLVALQSQMHNKIKHRLCGVRLSTVQVELGLGSVKLNPLSSDFSAKSLGRALDTPMINKQIAQAWLDKACTCYRSSRLIMTLREFEADRKSTLAFCVNRQHVRNLTHMFREANIDAHCIDGATPTKERLRLVASFKAGAYPVLVNCGKTLLTITERMT